LLGFEFPVPLGRLMLALELRQGFLRKRQARQPSMLQE
jgi:hypothetical protein